MGNNHNKCFPGPVGRADLALLLEEFPDVDRETIAGLLRYKYQPGKSSDNSEDDQGTTTQETAAAGQSNVERAVPFSGSLLSPLFWLVESREKFVEPTPRSAKDIDFGDGVFRNWNPARHLPFLPYCHGQDCGPE